MSIEQIGAFESTYMPQHDVDIVETSGHAERWRDDLLLMRSMGVRRLRYPIRWHRVEPAPGELRWQHTDRVLGFMCEQGMAPIVDLVHHTSYPRWLTGGFADPRFADAYVGYCEAFARRYPWIEEYTLFNEPFATLFLAGHEGIWPPYGRGIDALVGLLESVVPAIGEASRRLHELLPEARHVYVDTCEGHSAADAGSQEFAAMANDRRFFVLDALLGRAGDRDRPFVRDVATAGGEALLELEPAHVDVLGLDYYAHSEWRFNRRERPLGEPAGAHERHFQHPEIEGVTPSPVPVGPAALAVEYWGRYGLPTIFSETNIRGAASDRATWLKYTLEQCERAREAGVPISAYCWFPFIDSLDWNSLLARADRCIDPVGVIWLDERLARNGSTMSESYRRAVAGAPSSELPAYRFTPEVERWVSGLLPQMSHFSWQEPPAEEIAQLERGIVRAAPSELAA